MFVVLATVLLAISAASLQTPDRTHVVTPDFAQGVVQSCAAQYLYFPNSTEEVSSIVRGVVEEAKSGVPIALRVSRPDFHSSNRMPCPTINDSQLTDGRTGVHLYLTNMTQVFSADTDAKRIHVGAGMLMRDFLTALQANNMSAPVLATPIFDRLAMGAAVANEVHGTNLKGQGIFADLVVNATWVDGKGDIHTSGNMSTLAGAMGLTGIITELDIQALPLSKTRFNQSLIPDTNITREIQAHFDAEESFMVLWRPTFNRMYLAVFEELPEDAPSDDARLAFFEYSAEELAVIKQVTEADQQDVFNTKNDKYIEEVLQNELPWFATPSEKLPLNVSGVGWSNFVCSGDCLTDELCPWKVVKVSLRELAIDVADLPAFIDDVKTLVDTTKFEGNLPYGLGLWMRFVRGSDNWLGYAYGRDTVYIEHASGQGFNITDLPMKHQAFYEEVEQILFCKYNARPHWGKCTNRMFYPPCPVKDTLPMFNAFLAEQEKADPHGILEPSLFANFKSGQPSNQTYYPGCALNFDCYCQEDSHCQAPGSTNDFLYCGKGRIYPEARVCMVRSPTNTPPGSEGCSTDNPSRQITARIMLNEDKLSTLLSGNSEEERDTLAGTAAEQLKEKLQNATENFDEVVGDCPVELDFPGSATERRSLLSSHSTLTINTADNASDAKVRSAYSSMTSAADSLGAITLGGDSFQVQAEFNELPPELGGSGGLSGVSKNAVCAISMAFTVLSTMMAASDFLF
ncbi:hypothetical protein DUNSADRAFT_12887 [Dunaliella salina]|uniref:FAD-binding PCMH-type domain-containing protein n=1 Tax=Dunaliella salina TaxID=3046 RepID=A0ABQ7H3K5_DUNSA|nr:hypothetical protein DUNSADRAFT_12887 [Dunaliella salina]|eukprot:KAF5841443.1 hypothetical protein DUNSADRAFT_12887 [Dunaliella salina]